MEDAEQVDRHDPGEGVGRIVDHVGGRARDPGVVDEHVDAPAALTHAVGQRLGGRRIGDVDGLVQRALQLGRGPDVGQDDLQPVGHQPRADRLAQAARSPGDDGHALAHAAAWYAPALSV